MSEERELVVLMTRGTDHELSSVGFTIANGGMTAGFKKVLVFLTSTAVDLARRRAIDTTHVPPLDPLRDLVADFLRRGGRLVACTPCVKARGYTQQESDRRSGDRRLERHPRAAPRRRRLSELLASVPLQPAWELEGWAACMAIQRERGYSLG